MGKEIKQVIKIVEKVNELISDLNSIEKSTGLRTSASFKLKDSITSLTQYISSLINPDNLTLAKVKKAYLELKKQALKEGKTIDVKRLEVKTLVSEIKDLKLKYNKEQNSKDKSELQSELKLTSNKCAKKHKELNNEQLAYAEKLLAQKLDKI